MCCVWWACVCQISGDLVLSAAAPWCGGSGWETHPMVLSVLLGHMLRAQTRPGAKVRQNMQSTTSVIELTNASPW